MGKMEFIWKVGIRGDNVMKVSGLIAKDGYNMFMFVNVCFGCKCVCMIVCLMCHRWLLMNKDTEKKKYNKLNTRDNYYHYSLTSHTKMFS